MIPRFPHFTGTWYTIRRRSTLRHGSALAPLDVAAMDHDDQMLAGPYNSCTSTHFSAQHMHLDELCRMRVVWDFNDKTAT